MWKEKYSKALAKASTRLAELLTRDLEEVFEVGRQLDVEIRDVVVEIGRQTEEKVLAIAYQSREKEAKARGLTPQRRDKVQAEGVLGTLSVESPYLYDSDTGESARPLRDHFGIEGNTYSDALDRAISDFGAHTSHQDAAQRVNEHYGIDIGRTTVRSRTMAVAESAVEYVEERLSNAREHYDDPVAKRPVEDELFAEADGCLIRCGELMTAAEARIESASNDNQDELERLAEYDDDETVRLQNFREVRTGQVSKAGEVEPTYVSMRGSWDAVMEQLFGAACEKGLGFETTVVFAGDGGNGIKRAAELWFANLEYILDRFHLKGHVKETGEVIEEFRDGRPIDTWTDETMQRIDEGHVGKVLAEFEDLLADIPPPDPDSDEADEKIPHIRLARLIKFLTKFYESVHYGAYAANDWPMGSGRAESSHRSVVQARLKLPGACWKQENLTPMVTLRVILKNGWWADFWDWENERRRAA